MVYVKEAGASDLFRGVQFPVSSTEQSNKALRELVNDLFQKHKPSAHSFFRTLKNADKAIVTNKGASLNARSDTYALYTGLSDCVSYVVTLSLLCMYTCCNHVGSLTASNGLHRV